MKAQWRKLDGTRIGKPIEEEILAAIRKERSRGYELKVCIGTDSQVKSRETEFATVIVVLRKGRGGFMYICSEKAFHKMTIKERMLLEVSRSVEVAYQLSEIFQRYKVEMEVHADINSSPEYKSNVALKEAMGYILGMGFAFRAKPAAFASSSCANKIVQ